MFQVSRFDRLGCESKGLVKFWMMKKNIYETTNLPLKGRHNQNCYQTSGHIMNACMCVCVCASGIVARKQACFLIPPRF